MVAGNFPQRGLQTELSLDYSPRQRLTKEIQQNICKLRNPVVIPSGKLSHRYQRCLVGMTGLLLEKYDYLGWGLLVQT
jgi:hypothetical protein